MTITTDPHGLSDVDDEVDAIEYELPELNLLAAEPDDPDAAVRFAFLDPARLVPNDINRTFTDDDLADMLASVPVVGFLQAAVVVPINDESDRYRVLIGNRRRAVAERLNRQLPALVVRSGDSVQEILAILSEHDDRLALKPTEKAALCHQLTLLDWRPAQTAKARGVRTGSGLPSRIGVVPAALDRPTVAGLSGPAAAAARAKRALATGPAAHDHRSQPVHPKRRLMARSIGSSRRPDR